MAGKVARLPWPPGTKFFDVEGLPVALIPKSDGGLGARAFDKGMPRWFPIDSVDRNGFEISEDAFFELVEAVQTG